MPAFEKNMRKHKETCQHIAQLEFQLIIGDFVYELKKINGLLETWILEINNKTEL